MPDKVAAAVQSIKVTSKTVPGRNSDEPSITVDIRFWDKNAALEKLAKHLHLYDDQRDDKDPAAAFLAAIMGLARALPVAEDRLERRFSSGAPKTDPAAEVLPTRTVGQKLGNWFNSRKPQSVTGAGRCDMEELAHPADNQIETFTAPTGFLTIAGKASLQPDAEVPFGATTKDPGDIRAQMAEVRPDRPSERSARSASPENARGDPLVRNGSRPFLVRQ